MNDTITAAGTAAAHPHSRSLSGLRIAVTGATGGIGRCLLERLVAEGASVAATGSNAEKVAGLESALPGAVAIVADITDETAVREFYRVAVAELGGLDVVVNLAGLSVPGQIAETGLDSYERVMSVNVLGTFLSCKHAVGALADGGLIVNVGSLAGHRANPTAPLYCTAKAAVAMFSDALALQVKDNGIRVTNVTPGGVDTPFWGERKIDRSRLMSPGDVVEALLFVISRPAGVVVHDLSFEAFGRG